MATTWTITTDTETITADGVTLSDGHPDFTVGQEHDVTFLFNGSNHMTRYQNLKEYFEYMNEAVVTVGTDANGKAWYRETLHPDDTHRDKLIKLEPDASIQAVDSYWAVITNGQDDTRMAGAGEKVTLSVFIISKLSRYSTRSDVQADVEAER